ncbi:MAG: nuclear transport factor 2 family protein [Cyclobacteriaceae bacterium]|nr:nuclear transport factor 2 family protein [Cyclobacteriaceae bacterium]
MKRIFILGFSVYAFLCNAQSNKAITGLINAEKSFAATSAQKSTKVAFLENLADDAVLFKRGIVNGKKFWQEVPESNDKLTWEPQFADISIGGDFGYTTGPFQQFQNRTDEQPVGGGHYISVWQKLNGKWKVLIDAGVGHPPADLSTWETVSRIGTTKSKTGHERLKAEIETLESAFRETFKQKGATAFTDYLSTEARMYRPMQAPHRENNIAALLAETDKKFAYNTPVDTRIAPAGDMAFTYGNVDIEIIRDGNTRQLKGNYLRIWKKEKGETWKIVADVISL